MYSAGQGLNGTGLMVGLELLFHLILYCTIILSILGKIFSRRFEIFFLIFPRKQDLTFHANCLQFGDNLHEILNPVFLRKKNKKNISSICCMPREW